MWQCAQGQQRSAYPLDLNGSDPHFPSWPVVRISKNFGSIRHSISSEPFVRLISDCARRFKSARPRHSYFPKDTRHFPIREWLCLGADISMRRNLSCVLQEQRARILRVDLGSVGCDLHILKDLRLYGGAGSLGRTALSRHFPANREFNREVVCFGLSFCPWRSMTCCTVHYT